MTTRLTQLHAARAHLCTVLVLHDIPNAWLAERAPIVCVRGAA